MMSWYIDSSCITSPCNARPAAASSPAGPGYASASVYGRSRAREEPLCLPDPVGQGVGLLTEVVEVERGPGAGPHAERAVQRPGAVVSGPHRDAQVIEHLADVVRVDPFDGERDRAAPVRGFGGPEDAQPLDLAEDVQ